MDLAGKASFFKRRPGFNNLGLVLGMTLKFCTSVTKGLKLKVKKIWWLIPTFVEVAREKLVGKDFWFLIMNRVKVL